MPVSGLECDMGICGGAQQRPLLQKVGAFLFPNVAALGERGVPGTTTDQIIGGLKAAHNILLDIAVMADPNLAIRAAFGNGPRPLEIADNELVGAAIVEGGTAIGGAIGLLRSTAARAGGLADDLVVVRGGVSEMPPPGQVFSGAYGRTLEEAASGVPHGQIRATTVGQIRAGGGTVDVAPELTRSGVLNERHVNVCLGSGPCPFGALADKPRAESREDPMSSQWVPIRYRDFYDFPRAFVAEQSGELLFFDCPFNDALDDYETEFTVFKIREKFRDKVDEPSWKDLRRYADRVGVVSTGAVEFDETKRKAVNVQVFDLIG